jgi:23S rRNA (guanosine2251-2'-O)-methyltransferase
MGRNCVEEVARHAPARLLEVFVAEAKDGRAQGSGDRRLSIYQTLEDLGVPVRERRRDELDAMAQSDSHQGFVARVTPRVSLTLEELLEIAQREDDVRVLALDGVLDPHNLGAILRAAECFGITAVLWSRNRAAPVGPVVSKVSVGASELVPLCPVANLHRAIEALKELGVWSVGAMVARDAEPVASFKPPRKWLVVMGSEGEGIQRLIADSLDFRLYIPMLGEIDSLNVSQATAVFLHSLTSMDKSV